MRIFYGYQTPASAVPPDCERRYIDGEGTGRQEREDMIASLRPGAGDVVVLLARGDLGRGAEVPAMERAILDAGATISVEAPEKPAPRPPGPAPTFQPNADQDERIQALYRARIYKQQVLERAREIYGGHVSWDMLRRRYGARWAAN